MKNKVVIFLDTVAAKNKLQVDVLHELKFQPFFFVNRLNKASNSFFKNGGEQVKLENGFISRFKQIYIFLKHNKTAIHHVEIYPAGRYAFIYLFLSKWFSLKIIGVERGDLIYYNKKGYGPLVKFSMWSCYQFSDIIWYREIYMRPILEKVTKRKLFFLHNAIKINASKSRSLKDIDFLWVNRVIRERKYQWFISSLNNDLMKDTKNYLVGMQETEMFKTDTEYVKKNKPANLQLENYTDDPSEFFKRAKFFVLPSDIVFANHSLLEAMSFGVVPLVSQTPGSNLIVEHHKNGFLFDHTPEGLLNAMNEAVDLSEEEYRNYSIQSRKKIQDYFSEDYYLKGIENLYKEVI